MHKAVFVFYSLEAEYGGSVCRERIGEGIWLVIAFSFYGAENPGCVILSVQTVLLIQKQGEAAALRNADPVIHSIHWSKVADEEQVFLSCLIAAYKAENTAIAVIGIDPLEAVIAVV